jgi:spore protease
VIILKHIIDTSTLNIRTDLAIEEIKDDDICLKNTYVKDDIKVTNIIVDESNISSFNKKMGNYITIEFSDVTDFEMQEKIEKILISELKKIMNKLNIKENESCLIIGLGNDKSTPDSLGPLSINNIIVTNHFYSLGINVLEGFRNVSAFNPGVMGQTGLETSDVINAIVKEIKPDFLIVVDALKANSVERLNKTIQITDAGINPGSGIGNNRKEISKDVLNIPVIAIGVPTVVDTITIVNDTFKYITNHFSYMKENIDNPKEKLKIVRTNIGKDEININDKKELFGLIGNLSEEETKSLINEVLNPIGYNMIVTPKEIDFIINKLSVVISNSINNALHKNVTKL